MSKLTKFIRDITGATAAEKASQAQQAALTQQQQEAAKSDELKKDVLGTYDEVMPMIMGMLTGKIDPQSNPMAARSYGYLERLLGGLSGDNLTPEQIKSNELTDSYIDQLSGKTKTAEQLRADEWNAKYLDSLANSPDTAFNAGVAELARGTQNQNENIAKAMQNRGISSSGINVAALGSTAADRARGMSQLQGERVDRRVQNNGLGAEYAQGLANQQKEDYGLATNLAGAKADKGVNDIMQALNISNNWNQQAWNNLMGVLSGKTSLINNQAGANYAQGLNNLAGTYSNQAAGQSQLLGTVLGQAANTNAGQKFINNTTQGIGKAINTIGNVTGIAKGIQAIMGLIGL